MTSQSASNSPTSPAVAEDVLQVRQCVAKARGKGQSIGFVPTMGALHAGHVSLIERARAECGYVVVSIFVNPTQFGPHEDFQKYPRPRSLDLQICGDAGADLVFYPTVDVMYPAGYQTFVEVGGLSDILEGAIRPGHFRGVATVVTKLFMIAGADKAYFGQKDYQQQLMIRIMSRELNLPIEIVTCDTRRDPDGLAMSSRNAYLTPTEREAGLCLSRALFRTRQRFADGERNPENLSRVLRQEIAATPSAVVDYAVIVDPDTLSEPTKSASKMVALVAARFGTTRLIDNLLLESVD